MHVIDIDEDKTTIPVSHFTDILDVLMFDFIDHDRNAMSDEL